MNNQEENTIEIDVLSLLRTIWRKKFLILLTAILTTGLAFAYSAFLVTPQYDSTTRLYVVNQSSDNGAVITTQDLQAGSFLVRDYKEIILSQDVLKNVTTTLGLTGGIKDKITVTIPTDTRILSISVRDSDPDQAATIANTLRDEAAKKIIEVTKVSDVTTLEAALPAENPSTPQTKRNLVLGFVVGAFLATALVLVLEVLDDRVKRPQDIEEGLGMTLLGVVPHAEKLK
ncbi:Wzz/FepE/Etk N-terminal domain-containing protein [Streptococcus parasuis]|uniref:YveK family protein n=1 Tax=Streptococcus parasuis TaxID=1501662 RepID=UPI00240E6B64|nr:Wzz/FepE/Etk N-terminal domain-containing protein [Streptococcus parasuis]WFB91451.1 Wzz/FepE/Etk N-terminal domain-containing protein [Streptococcus parasuis]